MPVHCSVFAYPPFVKSSPDQLSDPPHLLITFLFIFPISQRQRQVGRLRQVLSVLIPFFRLFALVLISLCSQNSIMRRKAYVVLQETLAYLRSIEFIE